ncbi:sensor histidine kinase [Massilia sp. H6]|uniref:sensor histidine kinase n=1 Tax=Massilia sp. H6 TaxID=2970464 RepID=UPI00216A162B|nr:sensor histidine kinase [Massilia sp. H6]UVW28990.1 sensor histidine kinase [Massilia sp. H6]
MQHPIFSSSIACELDVIASRQRARQIATACGFSSHDQARIATAVSELARNVFSYALEGKVGFSLAGMAGAQTLVVVIEDAGPGIEGLDRLLARGDSVDQLAGSGLLAARRFMDTCDITTGNCGTRIVLTKRLPANARMVSAVEVAQGMAGVSLPSNVALSEAHHQNRELTDALAALQERQDELVEVSRRLEQTNERVEQLNHQLNEKAASLMSADRQKNEFLSMLSHELRGPLSAASMAAQLLKQHPEAAPQTISLSDLISRQVSHMSRLVEDLLDVSRVSRGLISIVQAEVDMRDVVHAAIEQIMPAAQRKDQRVDLTLPATACMVDGDATRLVQVIGNLLGNAIRYTGPGGQIALTLEEQGGRCALRVADNGQGIAPELLPHLFDLYVQAETSSDRQHGGLGLGLALVKSLLELHGGTVLAASEGIGRGSTFDISLPLAQAGAMAREQEALTSA